jgi:hypothetical protein
MLRTAPLLLSLFSLIATCHSSAWAAVQCRWDGTSPACSGSCRTGETQIRRSDGRDNPPTWEFGPNGEYYPGFGAKCITGTKSLCCPASPPPAKASTSPGNEFCEYYAAQAVGHAGRATKCGFSGPRWDTNKKSHFDWCMNQKGQSPPWSEHYAREGQLKDCAMKDAAAAPPKGNSSMSVNARTASRDVDVYALPGGVGKPLGILRSGSLVNLLVKKPDDWCNVEGNSVPQGSGWVWCGAGFELK